MTGFEEFYAAAAVAAVGLVYSVVDWLRNR